MRTCSRALILSSLGVALLAPPERGRAHDITVNAFTGTAGADFFPAGI